ncbi:hypothetical protein CCMA1212_006377 [Trichoderma ghanense]|uniref:DUF7514 domain-containing protein n=1 Tax=Trichoderma ghanense TaxID=65468 RepID=A0ABY2H0M6_9HYPO
MSAEATVLHGPLPSAHGNTASPTPRGGDERFRSLHASREHHHQQRRDSQSSYREQDKREAPRSRRDEDRDSAATTTTRPSSSSSSFPYRDIIKSVLSVMTRSDLSALTSAPAPASSSSSSSDKNLDKEREREKDVKSKDRQVEDVVRGLAMEEWNSRWLDELVAKVKGELNDTASDHSISENGPPTPLSDTSSKASMKRYQPTVEDYDESEDEASSIFDRSFAAASQEDARKPLTRTSSSLSNASSDSSSSSYSAASLASSSPAPSDKDSVPSPPSSVSSSSPPPRPTVRFADKQPPVIHYIPEPPEPEEPEDEREHEPEREREREREPYQPHPSSSSSSSSLQYQPHSSSSSSSLQYQPHSSSSSLSSLHQRQGPAWTALFNERDEPTPALGRFLRGLANYIIAEYAPIDSLVITPDKLFKFYTRYRLDNEFFPFQRVFDTRYHKSLRGISFLFTDLRCEHHLVQHSIASKPCIPALTPTGFEDWMTLMIRAFPDREARRLDLVLADIPLFSDDRTSSRSSMQGGQRLPRELPRELFPERGHARAFDLLASSFAEWKSITSVVVVPPEATTTTTTSSSSCSSIPPPSSSSSIPSSSHSQSHLHLHHPHTYATSSLIPPSLQKLPPAATKALKEDTRRHKDACYIDQSRLRPSSLIYPCTSSSSSPASPSSSFSTTGSSSSAMPASLEGKAASEGIVVSSAASSSSSSSSGSSSSKHRSSRSRDRESRHRSGASERSSRPREPSPPREGRRHHKSRRYRDS